MGSRWLLVVVGVLTLVSVMLVMLGPVDRDVRGLAVVLCVAGGLLLELVVELVGGFARGRGGRSGRGVEEKARGLEGAGLDPAGGEANESRRDRLELGEVAVHLRDIPEAIARVNGVDPRWRHLERLAGRVSASRGVGAGSGARLVGRWVVWNVFVGKDGRGWKDEEVARVMRAMERAVKWIAREAQAHGAGLELELCQVVAVGEDPAREGEIAIGFQAEGEEDGPFAPESSERALAGASRAVAGMGFGDLIEMLESVGVLAGAAGVIPVLHVLQGGRSHVVMGEEGLVPGAGIAVCYAREASFPEPLREAVRADATTYVHEILHLFGATDKYGQRLSTFARGDVTERDVMLLGTERLVSLRVDPLTAREVGWGA